MTYLYALTLALSAILMFAVQPIMSKIVLPVLGGNPAVWNACVMFFQLLLLAGYGYVHAGLKLLGAQRQAAVHLVLLAASVALLPIAIAPEYFGQAAYDAPVAWLLTALFTTVGVPFFLIACNAPLLQSWVANSSMPAARNPYMLYAASNLGSMIGLLAYPFVIEPNLSLSMQRMVWSVGYGALVLALFAAAYAWYLNPKKALAKTKKKKPEEVIKPITWKLRLKWLGLAFVPSSMMLAVTSHITTDIAPIPLLWVVPLALYLLSFVLVFADKPRGISASGRLMLPVMLPVLLDMGIGIGNLPLWPWGLLLVGYLATLLMRRTPDIHNRHLMTILTDTPVAFFLPLVVFLAVSQDYLMLSMWYVAAFFLVAMVCHGRLSEARPHPSQLTEFYLYLSLGGALGGMFNTLLAPMLFSGIYEMAICIALAFAALIRRPSGPGMKEPLSMAFTLVVVVGIWLVYSGQFHRLGLVDTYLFDPLTAWTRGKSAEWKELGFTSKGDFLQLIMILMIMVTAYVYRRRGMALFILAVLVVPIETAAPGTRHDIKFQDRNFFGVLQVYFNARANSMHLTNGTTAHGFQFKDAARATTPTSYYSWDGPLGALVEALRARPQGFHTPIAAVGLGTGTVACLAEPGQNVTFYEINPLVKQLANKPEYFSYLQRCKGMNSIVMGDARLSLQKAPDGGYGLIILDAFNSDAIPIHLMTKEALDLYLSKLSYDGIIAYHISNRHLDLLPVVGNLAATHNLYGVSGNFRGSEWVLVTRTSSNLGPLNQDGRFRFLARDERKRTWTDDFSDIVSAIDTRWF